MKLITATHASFVTAAELPYVACRWCPRIRRIHVLCCYFSLDNNSFKSNVRIRAALKWPQKLIGFWGRGHLANEWLS